MDGTQDSAALPVSPPSAEISPAFEYQPIQSSAMLTVTAAPVAPPEGQRLRLKLRLQRASQPGWPRDEQTSSDSPVHHDKSPYASLERLERLAGSIPLQGSVPSTKFLGERETEQAAERASD
jgi:hypothetical protein